MRSSFYLNSEINFPDFVEEHFAIFFKTFIRNHVLNSRMLYEKFGVLFANGQDNSLPVFLE